MKNFIIAAFVTMLMFSYDAIAQEANKNDLQPKEDSNKFHNHFLLKVSDKDMVIGKGDAKVVIIEYSSLNCPHCAKFHKEAFDKIKSDYIDKGQVLYVYRDFPLNRVALAGSILSHCAGKEKYFEFLTSLFDSQSIWAFHTNYMDSLLNIAKLGGVSEEKFKACQHDKALEDFITKRMMDAASSLDIHSTPTFFINGEKAIGLISYDEFKPYIEKALKKAEVK